MDCEEVFKTLLELKSMKFSYSLITFASFLCFACGSNDKAKTTSGSTSYTFDKDIAPIVLKSCAGAASCHGSAETGGGLGRNYQANKAAFIADKTKVSSLIQSTDTATVMPKPGYSISLSASDKQMILDYLSQSTNG